MWVQVLSWVLTVTFVVAGAVLAILKIAIPHFVTEAVNHRFNKKLEEHKHQLEQMTLAASHNYQ